MAREPLELRGLSDLLDMMRSERLGGRVSKRELASAAAPSLDYAKEVLWAINYSTRPDLEERMKSGALLCVAIYGLHLVCARRKFGPSPA